MDGLVWFRYSQRLYITCAVCVFSIVSSILTAQDYSNLYYMSPFTEGTCSKCNCRTVIHDCSSLSVCPSVRSQRCENKCLSEPYFIEPYDVEIPDFLQILVYILKLCNNNKKSKFKSASKFRPETIFKIFYMDLCL